MNLILNGKPYTATDLATVAELLERMDLAGRPVVVELDQRALLQREHSSTLLHEGAVIEVVQVTAGG
jgi:sulfur carrier protein